MTWSAIVQAGTLNRLVRGVTTFTPPAAGAIYAAPLDAGAEATGTGLSRQLLSFGAATAARPSVCTVAAQTSWGTIGADWPADTEGLAWFNAAAGGIEMGRDVDPSLITTVGEELIAAAGVISASWGTGKTNWTIALLQAVLEWLFRGGPVPPQHNHMGLLLNGTEIETPGVNGYARLDVASIYDAATVATPSVLDTSSPAPFTASAGGAWGDWNEWALFPASTGGTAGITVPRTGGTTTVNLGDPVNIAAGAIPLSLGNV